VLKVEFGAEPEIVFAEINSVVDEENPGRKITPLDRGRGPNQKHFAGRPNNVESLGDFFVHFSKFGRRGVDNIESGGCGCHVIGRERKSSNVRLFRVTDRSMFVTQTKFLFRIYRVSSERVAPLSLFPRN